MASHQASHYLHIMLRPTFSVLHPSKHAFISSCITEESSAQAITKCHSISLSRLCLVPNLPLSTHHEPQESPYSNHHHHHRSLLWNHQHAHSCPVIHGSATRLFKSRIRAHQARKIHMSTFFETLLVSHSRQPLPANSLFNHIRHH